MDVCLRDHILKALGMLAVRTESNYSDDLSQDHLKLLCSPSLKNLVSSKRQMLIIKTQSQSF